MKVCKTIPPGRGGTARADPAYTLRRAMDTTAALVTSHGDKAAEDSGRRWLNGRKVVGVRRFCPAAHQPGGPRATARAASLPLASWCWPRRPRAVLLPAASRTRPRQLGAARRPAWPGLCRCRPRADRCHGGRRQRCGHRSGLRHCSCCGGNRGTGRGFGGARSSVACCRSQPLRCHRRCLPARGRRKVQVRLLGCEARRTPSLSAAVGPSTGCWCQCCC